MKKNRLFIILGVLGVVAVTGVIIFMRRRKKKKIEEEGYDINNMMKDTATGKTKVVIAKTTEFSAGDKVGIQSPLYKGKFKLYKVSNVGYTSTVLYVDTPYKGLTTGTIWKA